MADVPALVEKHIRLRRATADRLHEIAERRHLSEDVVVERALEVLFSLTEQVDDQAERAGWSALSEESRHRVCGNDQDTAYDKLRTLYGVSG